MAYHLIIHSEEDDRIYSREIAARLARISIDVLDLCEQEELIKAGRMSSGPTGFTRAEIQELTRIRRLREDLGLDLAAVEVVLHMRRRMIELLQEVDAIERQKIQREQELYSQIRQLRRRLSEEGNWE